MPGTRRRLQGLPGDAGGGAGRGPRDLGAGGRRDDLETIPEEFIDAGEHVVVTVRYTGRGRGSGIALDARSYEVLTVRDGLCVSKTEFAERGEALRAAGLQA